MGPSRTPAAQPPGRTSENIHQPHVVERIEIGTSAQSGRAGAPRVARAAGVTRTPSHARHARRVPLHRAVPPEAYHYSALGLTGGYPTRRYGAVQRNMQGSPNLWQHVAHSAQKLEPRSLRRTRRGGSLPAGKKGDPPGRPLLCSEDWGLGTTD